MFLLSRTNKQWFFNSVASWTITQLLSHYYQQYVGTKDGDKENIINVFTVKWADSVSTLQQ